MKNATYQPKLRHLGLLFICLSLGGYVYTTHAQGKSDGPKDVVAGHVMAGLELPTLGGVTLSEKELSGKVILVVNVASQCGFTRQYTGLQALHDKYGPQGFSVIGVPCNQFGGQEPGNAQEILDFTKSQYGINFPLLTKQNVNGGDRSPLLQRLMGQSTDSSDVRWNFEKFLIGRDGQVIDRFRSGVGPESGALVKAIESALATPAASKGP